MSCDTLQVGLGEASRPEGDMAPVNRMAGQGICRTFSFAPPVVIPASQLVTFAVDPILTFAGDFIQTF